MCELLNQRRRRRIIIIIMCNNKVSEIKCKNCTCEDTESIVEYMCIKCYEWFDAKDLDDSNDETLCKKCRLK